MSDGYPVNDNSTDGCIRILWSAGRKKIRADSMSQHHMTNE